MYKLLAVAVLLLTLLLIGKAPWHYRPFDWLVLIAAWLATGFVYFLGQLIWAFASTRRSPRKLP